MSNADRALGQMREYFKDADLEEHRRMAKASSPALLGRAEPSADKELAELGLVGLPSTSSFVASGSTVDSPSMQTQVPLTAYLASALTGLNGTDRQLVFHISDTIGVICRELGIDLYEPRKATDPVHNPDVADSKVFQLDKERVSNSDLVIYLALHPSTGSGEELIIAHNAMVPIVIVSHGQMTVSRMVTGIPGMILKVHYEEPEELRAELRSVLEKVRPQLVQRKLAFASYDANIVGDRIRKLREGQGISREQLVEATATRSAISYEMLVRLEESKDRDSNPSLLVLRELASALKTSVADLVEPDLEEVLLGILSTWVDDRSAARFGSITTRDRNRVLRRLLLRLIDGLEVEES